MDGEKTWRNEKRHRDGSIKVIKGKLYARIQYLDEATGKRKEKLKPAPNRTKAKEFIKEMRRELKDGGGQTALESSKTTFEQAAEKYERVKLVQPVFQNGLKVAGLRSFQNQKYKLKPLIDYFGRRKIRAIKAGDLESYKIERLNTPVVVEKKVKKPNPEKGRKKFIYEKIKVSRPRGITSVNRELALLRQIFVFAEAEDLISRNPFAKASKIISTAAEVCRDRVLSAAEEASILKACEKDARRHIRPIVITALDTAARRGELLKLQWKDVDLSAGIITIQATNAKTEKTRLVGMTARVKDELSKLWEASPKDESILVFGVKCDFKRAWTAVRKEVGVLDLHFHDLRHTAITRMIRAGVPASEVMKISGHTKMQTFLRYLNLTNDSVTTTANLLDSFNAGQKMKTETASEMVN